MARPERSARPPAIFFREFLFLRKRKLPRVWGRASPQLPSPNRENKPNQHPLPWKAKIHANRVPTYPLFTLTKIVVVVKHPPFWGQPKIPQRSQPLAPPPTMCAPQPKSPWRCAQITSKTSPLWTTTTLSESSPQLYPPPLEKSPRPPLHPCKTPPAEPS